MGLVQAYEYLFAKHDIHTAQVLLTQDNLTDANRFENISSTLENLLEFGTVPVINENDTVATEEIKFGDNDTLAALVANLISADKLIILTDQKGVFDDDPRNNSEANLIHKIRFDDEKLLRVAGKTSGSLGFWWNVLKSDGCEAGGRIKNAYPYSLGKGRGSFN